MSNNRVFTGLKEGPVNFRPTYKLEVGTNEYSASSKKVRVPSWTDRILFRCNVTPQQTPNSNLNLEEGRSTRVLLPDPDGEVDDGEQLQVLTYKSMEDLKQSDHRPVVAIFAGPRLAGRNSAVAQNAKARPKGNAIGEVASQVCIIS